MDNKKQIAKAIRYIEAHLKEKLLLEDIAQEANFSPWHFHRVFLASTGITVGEYIRKRRMSEATRELAFTKKSIRVLAKEYQYESQEAFSRSFKAFCGCSPALMRKNLQPMISYKAIIYPKKGDNMLTPELKHKDAFRVIGISCQNTMKQNNIPALWDKFLDKACDKISDSINPDVALGICYMMEETAMTDDTPFTYLAGLQVAMDATIPEGMEDRVVPAADYAVFQHKGSLETLGATYDSIYGDWLPNSEYNRVSHDDFELYDDRFHYGAPDSIMEIWVPVKKKA